MGKSSICLPAALEMFMIFFFLNLHQHVNKCYKPERINSFASFLEIYSDVEQKRPLANLLAVFDLLLQNLSVHVKGYLHTD